MSCSKSRGTFNVCEVSFAGYEPRAHDLIRRLLPARDVGHSGIGVEQRAGLGQGLSIDPATVSPNIDTARRQECTPGSQFY